jgi:protein phosphatase
MGAQAMPEAYIETINVGDRILLCSDGLHGMVEEERLPRLLRGSRNPSRVTKQLIDEANRMGGRDNISAVYIKIIPGSAGFQPTS